MPEVFNEKIKNIAYDIFEITCYMFPLEEWELDEAGEIEIPEDAPSSLVKFNGAVEGGMIIRVSPDLMNAIAANMLGADRASEVQKEGALCEIANMICGNTVPLYAKNDKICYIRPPVIIDSENESAVKHSMNKPIRINLDEGAAEITIFFEEDKS